MKTVKLRSAIDNTYIDESLRAYRLNPVVAYDDKNDFYVLNDNYLGLFFICEPVAGTNDQMHERIISLMKQDFPANSALQFMLFKSPDINKQMYDMMGLRDHYNDPFLKANIRERKNFFTHHTHEPLVTNNSKVGMHDLGLVYDLKLFFSFKFPIANATPTDEEIVSMNEWRIKLTSALKQSYLNPRIGKPREYIRAVSSLLNWNQDTTWRHDMTQWDENAPINEQILDYKNAIDISDRGLKVGDYHVACMSAKHFPEVTYFGNQINFIGELSGQSFNLRENYAIVANIIIPDQQKAKAQLDKKRQYAVNQSDGPLQRYIPVLKDKREAFDLMYESIKEGNTILNMSYTILLFTPTRERLNSAIINAQSHWRSLQYEILEDRYMHLPIFVNCLPLCTEVEAKRDLFRYKTVTSEQVAPLIPILGEWKGTGIPHVSLISRNGQLMSLSLHGAGTNNNAVIAAQSGSGKSFLVNDIIMSYLSEGAQVWVIDVGRSYEKLCETLNGDFIHFASDADICLSPFELVTNYEEDEDMLVELVRTMASPKGLLDELQEARLKKIVGDLYHSKGNDMNIDDVAERCLSDEDPRIKDIGALLNAFTSSGNYGKYFAKANNIKFDNQFTVLELDDLQGRQHLRQVVLLQLIFQIQQAVYFGDRSVKKLVIIDEGWDLLGSGETAKFLEHSYRKFRKYGGSVLISTQSINDLYSNPHGQAIAENSASMYLLGQKEESIEAVRSSKRLVLDEAGFNTLRSVHTVPGVYSEIFVRTQGAGIGVGRLVVGEYQKLLYSTDAMDVAAIKRYTDKGVAMEEAILNVIKDRE